MILLMLGGLAFSLLNCFMGYHLRKVWGCILGAILGGMAGITVGYYNFGVGPIMWLCGAGGALILGILAWFFYKLGVFLLCGGLVCLGIIYRLLGTGEAAYIIGATAGILTGIMAVKFEGYLIIAITGISGGLGSMQLLFALSNREETLGAWILGAILSCIGMIIQYAALVKDTKKRKNKKLGIRPPKKISTKEKLKFKNPIWGSDEDYAEEDYDYDYDEDEEEYEKIKPVKKAETVKKAEPEKEKKSEPVVMQAGTYLDLDDMNRELSREITKICDEEE